MKIRRIQYNIICTHILSFKDEYKVAIAPYFGYDGIRYLIENEGFIDERVRLIFSNEKIILFLGKEGISIIFEGDIEELKNSTGIIAPFWELYEKVAKFKGFAKTSIHSLIVHSVKIMDNNKVNTILKNNPFLNNPFGELEDFACVYHYKKEDINYKIHFGNYSNKDVKIHDLSPFKSEYNSDLNDTNVGLMMRLEINEAEKNPTFSKFKTLLHKAEKTNTVINEIIAQHDKE